MSDVSFQEIAGQGGQIGSIILTRPKALNALNLSMLQLMHHHLKKWADDSQIKAVVIQGEGRAFCAGGDLRELYASYQAKDPGIIEFFIQEYALNRLIYHFPKPYIALLNGITMGGGAGISIHGSHCVGTEQCSFAMPETTIGFYPDVGGTYFLPRLPGSIGMYLGLTGVKINCDDAKILGLLQHSVSSSNLSEIIETLAKTPFQDPYSDVSRILASFEKVAISKILEQRDKIDSLFNHEDFFVLIHGIQERRDPFALEIWKTLQQKAPLSLAVTHRALIKGKHLEFDACMDQESRLTEQFLQGHDFIEGIRALLIDKGQTPHWQPPSLKDVKAAQVDEYFE